MQGEPCLWCKADLAAGRTLPLVQSEPCCRANHALGAKRTLPQSEPCKFDRVNFVQREPCNFVSASPVQGEPCKIDRADPVHGEPCKFDRASPVQGELCKIDRASPVIVVGRPQRSNENIDKNHMYSSLNAKQLHVRRGPGIPLKSRFTAGHAGPRDIPTPPSVSEALESPR